MMKTHEVKCKGRIPTSVGNCLKNTNKGGHTGREGKGEAAGTTPTPSTFFSGRFSLTNFPTQLSFDYITLLLIIIFGMFYLLLLDTFKYLPHR